MRRIATDDPVAWCISLSVTRLRCAKTAERIEVLFGVATFGDPRPIAFYGDPDPPTARGIGKKFYPLQSIGILLALNAAFAKLL